MDIPDDITGSCYTGQMHVLFKDTTFEVPSWDGTEIVSILGERAIDYPVVACTLMGGQTLVDVY